jgi:hypothetical protein
MIEWDIRGLEVKSGTDIVVKIHWTVSASENDLKFSFDGDVTVPEPSEGSNFTPFSDLTKNQVVEWVKTALGERLPEITKHVLLGLDDIKNMGFVPKPLPW